MDDNRAFYLEMLQRLKREGQVEAATRLSGQDRGAKMFAPARAEDDLFTERIYGCITVVVCGGGHVALALERILKMLELRLIVVDDRPEYADRKRFSLADEVCCQEYDEFFARAQLPADSYYIIVTHGHQKDQDCLRQILARPHGYVGMIGSRRKVAASFALLRQEGFTEEQIGEVYAPIGLPIGGNAPAEIAVSIAAQLIQYKTERAPGASGMFGRDLAEALVSCRAPCVMVTVLEIQGSSPGKPGNRMLVGKEGILAGSIGGGKVEYMAIDHAREHCGTVFFDLREYDLSDRDEAGVGMVCGGRVKVMFEGMGAWAEK